MLGRHRSFFNQSISECAGLSSGIIWLDFSFGGIEYKVLMNAVFFKEPDGINGIYLNAVGKVGDMNCNQKRFDAVRN